MGDAIASVGWDFSEVPAHRLVQRAAAELFQRIEAAPEGSTPHWGPGVAGLLDFAAEHWEEVSPTLQRRLHQIALAVVKNP